MRRKLLFLIFLITFFIGKSQVTTEGYGFYEFTPYKGHNAPYSSISDSEGNVYITGTSSNEEKPTSDFITIKISPEGELLWESRGNTTDFVVEMGMIIALDDEENPVVSGSTWNGDNMDIETVKYDKLNGERIWTTTWDGNANGMDTPVDIAIDNQGNIIIAGYSYQSNPDRNEYATIKISSEGEMLWSVIDSFYEQGLSFFPSSVAVDNSGNVAIAGYGWKLLDHSEGYQTYYTIKYSPDGNELWKDNHIFEAEGNNGETLKTNGLIKDVEFDQYGNCYVLGHFSTFEIPSTIGIIKYNTSGEKEWIQTYNKDGWTQGWFLKLTDDVLYIGGKYSYGYVLSAFNFEGENEWENELDEMLTDLMDRSTYLTIGSDNLPVFCGLGISYENDLIKIKIAKYSEEGDVIKYYEYNPDIQNFTDLKSISSDQFGNVYLSMENESVSEGTYFDSVKLDLTATNSPLLWSYKYTNQGGSNSYPVASTSDENGNTYVLNNHRTVSSDNTLLDNVFLTKYNTENTIEWVKDIGVYNTSKYSTNVNSSGEVIITIVAIDPLYNNPENIMIKKFSSSGEILWTKEKQLHSVSINSVITDEAGNIFLAGSAKENVESNKSFLLAKFSNQGEEIWIKYINSEDDTNTIYDFYKIEKDSNQNIVAIGNYGYGDFWTGQVTQIAVLKMDQEGSLIWWQTIPSENTSNVTDCYLDTENNIYIVGSNSQAPILAKISSQGEIDWTKTYTEPDRQISFYEIEPLSNGNFVVSASSLGGGFDPITGMPFHRIAIVEYNFDGIEQNVVHTENNRYYKEMHIDNQDNVYILNKIESTTNPYRELYWMGPLFQAGLFVLDNDGNTNELIFGGPNLSQYEPFSLIPQNDGRLLILGRLFHEFGMYSFSGSYLFETTHETETLGVNDPILENAEMNYLGQNYPNPTSDYTTIPFKIKETGNVSLDLYDASGKYVRNLFNGNLSKGNQTVSVNVFGLTKGIYFYQLSSGNFKASKKMIVK